MTPTDTKVRDVLIQNYSVNYSGELLIKLYQIFPTISKRISKINGRTSRMTSIILSFPEITEVNAF